MQRSRKGAGFQKQPVPYLYGTNAFDAPRVELGWLVSYWPLALNSAPTQKQGRSAPPIATRHLIDPLYCCEHRCGAETHE